MRAISCTVAAVLLAAASTASADTTPQTIPFAQDWSDAGLITTNNVWDDVPGIVGYQGNSLTSEDDVDPQTVVNPNGGTVHVVANLGTPNNTGGLAELAVANPTVALQGSGTADAPHLVIYLDLTGKVGAIVDFDARDMDSNADNAAQQIAVQYRIGTSGDFINLPVGYIADATEPNAATLVTHRTVHLPALTGGQAHVEVRIITTNADAADEWVGIDNISITEGAAPGAVGTADPATLAAGDAVHLMAMVTAGALPASTGLAVTCDATAIGGAADTDLFDDGAHSDGAAGDLHFGFDTTVGATVAAGTYQLPCTVSDAETRSTPFAIALEVTPVCGDGRIEGAEACDDDDTDPDDGCSATCTIEAGWTCTGAPSVCDFDECVAETDNCDANATCTNTPGSFTCACNGGYSGDGVTCANIDECTDNVDDCVAAAACADTPGSYTCTCPTGYAGDGTTAGTGCTDVNECATDNGGCSEFATCTNTDGSRTCACNAGYEGDGLTCAATCGDAIVATPETCDDDGTEDGDGCSATCTIEEGWSCTGMPSDCTTICGDGVIVGAEECDDDDTDAADGCDATCAVEDGWICKNEPSTCSETAACGDGVLDAGEECDDGNDASEDGCDATCVEETGFVCDEEEPTNCQTDADGDNIADSEDNCPDVANPSQFDVDDDGVGAACDEDENAASGSDSGCCSTSHDDRSLGGFGLLAMLTVLGLRLRRRVR